jgi:hypothetical protein
VVLRKLWGGDRKNAVARAGRVFEGERVSRGRCLGDGGVAELEGLGARDHHVAAERKRARAVDRKPVGASGRIADVELVAVRAIAARR